MKKIFFIIILVFTIISCNKDNDIPDSIDFVISGGLPMIKCELNGKVGYFLIDTGANISIIDEGVTNKYNVTIYSFLDLTVDGIGGENPLYQTNNTKLTYKGQVMRVNFKSTDLSNLTNHLGFVGIIGSDFLIQNKIIIDYKNKVIRTPNIID